MGAIQSSVNQILGAAERGLAGLQIKNVWIILILQNYNNNKLTGQCKMLYGKKECLIINNL